ncbi:MAG: hypothetical protein K2N87_19565 [Eubacterium sp.]|nr:hypothetical protein [Eubacterium sp.]
MNKSVINDELAVAYDAVKEAQIANEKGEVNKTYRGQVTSFGAAVLMGSLLPSIAFFSDSKKSSVDRTKILEAIFYILKQKGKIKQHEKDLFEYAKTESDEKKEEILNAATALKLAMNLYHLTEETENEISV